MIFRYGGGGALTCDLPIPGLTQELDHISAPFYGGRYFVAESMSRQAAKIIVEALGGILLAEKMPVPPEKQLTA